MTEIYRFINESDVDIVDDYTHEAEIFEYEEVMFRTNKVTDATNISSSLWYTLIATYKEKIINISTKLFSFLPIVYHHYLGNEYSVNLNNTYNALKNDTKVIEISDPVYLFYDYESVTGTGHSFDLMFYLLYMYFEKNVKAKLLIPSSDDVYFKKTINLIKRNFHVEFLEIDINVNYNFKKFYCTRTYQNVYFHHVKDFINKQLIEPIIEKYSSIKEPWYDIVCKLKLKNDGVPYMCLIKTKEYELFCQQRNIFVLDNMMEEEYKIYLLNKASKIIIGCGSMYVINIEYYLIDTNNKYISVVYCKGYEGELWFLQKKGNKFLRTIGGHCGHYTDQVYNTLQFTGEVNFVKDINEFISITKI